MLKWNPGHFSKKYAAQLQLVSLLEVALQVFWRSHCPQLWVQVMQKTFLFFLLFFVYLFVLVFQHRVYLCDSSDCPETHFIDQAGLELTEIHLSLPTKFWDYRRMTPLPSYKKLWLVLVYVEILE